MSLQEHFRGGTQEVKLPVSKSFLEKLRAFQNENYPTQSVSDIVLVSLFSHCRVLRKHKKKSKPLSASALRTLLDAESSSSLALPSSNPEVILESLTLSIPNIRPAAAKRSIDSYGSALLNWFDKRIVKTK